MAGPAFGFSLGDFITGIGLMKRTIETLHDSAGAKPHYRRFIEESAILEQVLKQVQELGIKELQALQGNMLEEVVGECEKLIVDFLKKHEKLESALGVQATSPKWSWRTNMHKVQWAICKENEFNKLRAKIARHSLIINKLLSIKIYR